VGTVNLSYAVVTDPDSFVGFKYYVKAGDAFDPNDFAHSYKLNRADLDAADVLETQAAAANLVPGEWLTVSHSVAA
jgi:hypothetical protein